MEDETVKKEERVIFFCFCSYSWYIYIYFQQSDCLTVWIGNGIWREKMKYESVKKITKQNNLQSINISFHCSKTKGRE